MSTNPFPIVGKAVTQLLAAKVEGASGKVGGDLDYQRGDGLFIWVSLTTGVTNQLEGEWALDIDVFGDDYNTAMNNALKVEAAIIGPRHVTPTLLLDNCYQNEAPNERPWDDEEVFRIGATYTFTARRPASSA